LQPLWNMRSATTTLLLTSAVLVFLLNAAYQDGQGGAPVFRLVRTAGALPPSFSCRSLYLPPTA
jgi:hypothetical protein